MRKQYDQRLIDGAYAAADRHALAHIRAGIVGYRHDGEPALYSTTPTTETRQDGTMSYNVTVYRNVTRP